MTMKKMFFIASIACLLGTSSMMAEKYTAKLKNGVFLQETEKKTKVTEDELPLAVKNLLKQEEYKDWKLDEAYLITGTSEYYKIELKKDDQKQALNLDKYGNKVSILENK